MEFKWVMIGIVGIMLCGNGSAWLIEREHAKCVVEVAKTNRTTAEVEKMCGK